MTDNEILLPRNFNNLWVQSRRRVSDRTEGFYRFKKRKALDAYKFLGKSLRNKICMEKNYANDCMHISVNDIDMEGFHFFYDGTWMGGKTNLNKNIRTLFRRKVSILILNPLNKRWNDFFLYFSNFHKVHKCCFSLKTPLFNFVFDFFFGKTKFKFFSMDCCVWMWLN